MLAPYIGSLGTRNLELVGLVVSMGPPLVCLVYLVYLVCLVYLVGFNQPNKQNKLDKPNNNLLMIRES